MSRPAWPPGRRTRWSRRALRVIGVLVPSVDRGDWRREWEAELWQLLAAKVGPGSVAAFLAGAAWHALWERTEGWSMESLIQDVRFAARTLRRSPGFAVAALATLALSIGGSTAFFSVVERAILMDPPFREPERIAVVDILFGMTGADLQPSRWSVRRYRDLVAEVGSFSELAGYGQRTVTLTDFGDAEIVPIEVVTPSLLPLLGVQIPLGRGFGSEEDDYGAAALVALVSDGFWRTRLGSSPDAVGSYVTLNQQRFQVIGVVPESFRGVGGAAQMWVPASALRALENASAVEDPWNHQLHVLGRLSPGVTLEAARDELRAFGSTLMARYPAAPAASRLLASADAVPFVEARVNPLARVSALMLFGAVLLVLLIATANLAGLLLARGATRGREAAVRSSLGAGRARLLRQLLTESLALSTLGGLLGIGVAALGVEVLGVWLADALGTGGGRGLEYLDPEGLSINGRVLAFALVVTGAVGVGFGLLPAWHGARTDPSVALRGGSVPRGRTRRRLRAWLGRDTLIAVQVAVALVLLTGASLMTRSLVRMQSVDTGYDPAGLLTATYALSPADRASGIEPTTFHASLVDRVRQLPDVLGASVGEVPLAGPAARTIVLASDGRPDLTPQMHAWVRVQVVADGHAELLGVPVTDGRGIERSDDGASEPVIMLSQEAVREFFPDGDAIGRRISLAWRELQVGARVVGVFEAVQLDPPGTPLEPQAWVSARQVARLETGVLVRTRGDPYQAAQGVRSALAELAPGVALTSVASMRDRQAERATRPRVLALLLGAFGAVALFLMAIGLYGSLSFAVARRTPELGLRASLGAGRGSLAMHVLRHGLGVTLLGIAAGALGVVWTTPLLESLLFEVEASDPASLTGAAMLLIAVAVAAALHPARRALSIDPMVALRSD